MGFFDNLDADFTPPEGRVEAVDKVTGKGKYAAEYKAENICYAVVVTSTVVAGTIKSFNLDAAKQAEGVIEILTHLNKPVVPGLADEAKIKESRLGLAVLHTDKIYFKGQPIALVVAQTLEEATYAASLVTAEYTTTVFNTDFDKTAASTELKTTGKDRGSLQAWSNSSAMIDAQYSIKNEVHSPMEMHATIAHWLSDDKLKLYDKTQGVNGVQRSFARLFNLKNENIEVVAEFVGGGFGSGLRIWSNTLLATMAAKMVKRPVKLMLTRPQMFSMVGYRPQSWQRIKLGADSNGKFLGMLHQAKHTTSVYENFNEGITRITRLIFYTAKSYNRICNSTIKP